MSYDTGILLKSDPLTMKWYALSFGMHFIVRINITNMHQWQALPGRFYPLAKWQHAETRSKIRRLRVTQIDLPNRL